MSEPHVRHFLAAIELISMYIGQERSGRDYRAHMPEWGPDSRTYAHADGVIRGLQLALDVLQSEYGAACAEAGAEANN